jgi:adenylate kinase family enzyme
MMENIGRRRIVIFGNSGSGKSTLARELSAQYDLSHLDLDSLAWLDVIPPTRAPFSKSCELIDTFVNTNKEWVIEGCYSDLLLYVMRSATEVIFLNPGIDACVSNAKFRPWESHKYDSIEEQNMNLPMLVEWIEEYSERNDEFSLQQHRRLYDEFQGEKREYHSNDRNV